MVGVEILDNGEVVKGDEIDGKFLYLSLGVVVDQLLERGKVAAQLARLGIVWEVGYSLKAFEVDSLSNPEKSEKEYVGVQRPDVKVSPESFLSLVEWLAGQEGDISNTSGQRLYPFLPEPGKFSSGEEFVGKISGNKVSAKVWVKEV